MYDYDNPIPDDEFATWEKTPDLCPRCGSRLAFTAKVDYCTNGACEWGFTYP
jgi:hypothetical protein